MVVSSKSNPAVKRIRGLNRRKTREAEGVFFVEGLRLVGEALATGARIEQVVVAPQVLRSRFGTELVERLCTSGVQLLEVTPDVFASLAGKDHPQGIGAVVHQRWGRLETLEPGPMGWVALHEIQDPGNLGTILRTSDAAGTAGVILLGATTDPYDPTAVRASMGAVFSQAIARTDLATFLAWAQNRQLPVIATSDAALDDYESVNYPLPLLLLMGSEQKGLPPEALAAADLAVRIPMAGRSDSLNLAVATGIVLFRVVSQSRHAR